MGKIKCFNPDCNNKVDFDNTRGYFIQNKKVCKDCHNDNDVAHKIYRIVLGDEEYEKRRERKRNRKKV